MDEHHKSVKDTYKSFTKAARRRPSYEKPLVPAGGLTPHQVFVGLETLELSPNAMPAGDDEVVEILKLIDKDFDGEFSFEEFEETMRIAKEAVERKKANQKIWALIT